MVSADSIFSSVSRLMRSGSSLARSVSSLMIFVSNEVDE